MRHVLSLRSYFVLFTGVVSVACAGYFLMPVVVNFVGSGEWSTVSRATAGGCVKEVENLADETALVAMGNGYFGGDRGYDLVCAKAAFERSVELNPSGNIYAWHQLGRIAFIEGDFDAAVAAFDKQTEYFGEQLPNVHYMQGLTYAYRAQEKGVRADWDRAEVEFLRYLELDSMSPWARTDLAWVYFAQGKFNEMKPILAKGLCTHPQSPWLLNMYGLALLNTGARDEARIYFNAALFEVEKLSSSDWGRAYPGNDPASWGRGLSEMILLIKRNVELAGGDLQDTNSHQPLENRGVCDTIGYIWKDSI